MFCPFKCNKASKIELQPLRHQVGLLKRCEGDEDATGNVLRKFLVILGYTVKHTKGHVEFLRSFVGLTNQEIFKIFRVF